MKPRSALASCRLLLVLSAGVWGLPQVSAASAADTRPADAAPCLAAVRQFADQVLKHGRDVYGKPTPLFIDVGKIRGDRAVYQYGDDFPGHRVVEGTLFPTYGNTPQVEPQVGRLLLGEQLGDAGRDFIRSAVEVLTAWGKSAYRREDNSFIPMLTDGTSMEGYVCKKDGYFGPKGRVLRAGHPGPAHFWVYALAYRLSGERFLWDMARNIAQGNGWGDIGESPAAAPRLRFPDGASDPRLLFALLELHRRGGQTAFLEQAQVIGRNILKQRVYQGWFVPSRRHVYCRLSNHESQALLHLAAAILGKPDAVPAFTGAEPFFQAEYGAKTGRVYDSDSVYRKTR